ncbi:hypothetical protein AVEN_188585-1 [Araneus ventricosus]|uniref:Uncharacterized protein n=1 Tax=Araneus ventricosus TaxID=182803 RepID=A0A4Y2HQQ6_ARAVE|nr:hypothetical protein AVEN_188585-1 [Araneus ventricosus]
MNTNEMKGNKHHEQISKSKGYFEYNKNELHYNIVKPWNENMNSNATEILPLRRKRENPPPTYSICTQTLRTRRRPCRSIVSSSVGNISFPMSQIDSTCESD